MNVQLHVPAGTRFGARTLVLVDHVFGEHVRGRITLDLMKMRDKERETGENYASKTTKIYILDLMWF